MILIDPVAIKNFDSDFKNAMKIQPFETEHFFAKYEFNTRYQLCNSDCETMSVAELCDLANIPLMRLGEQKLGYTDSQGSPQLRQGIAGMYSNIDENDVVVLASPVEGIYLTARAVLEPNDEVIVLTPAYDALINMFEHVVGPANVKRWVFKSTDQGWNLDFDDLKNLISPKTKLIVVNFPHNPTGYLPTPEFQQNLIDFSERNKIQLFCDEMYFGLVHDGVPPIPSAADISKNTIVLSGLSKTYGLPGLRSGWLIIQDPSLRAELIDWKFYTSICAPSPSEYLATAATQVWKQLRDRSLGLVNENKRIAAQFFDRWPNLFQWNPPQGGSTALVGFHVDSVTEISERLATEADILIQPGTTLGSDDQHMRIGLGRKQFPLALAQFEAWLTAQGF